MDLDPIGDGDRPNPARMYDYMLGGGYHFAVDRAQVERMLARSPGTAEVVRANRGFQRRAVRRCAERGIVQFLELGSGIPSIGSVHEVARRVRPHARVAYVDHDAVAVAHADEVMAGDALLSATLADVADPSAVLGAPGVAGLLDLDRPLAVLACAVLHFLPDGLRAVVEGYRRVLAPGSVLMISHAHREDDGTDTERLDAVQQTYGDTPTRLVLRSRAEIVALFDGVDLVPPGVVDVRDWPRPRVDGSGIACAEPGGILAGVGVVPGDEGRPFADHAGR